ncbi:RNA polymerase sporulation sigma factor SigK [Agathobacter sp.]
MNTFLSPLSQERERECLEKLKQNDKEAREELILHNMRLVAHVTKKYASGEEEMEELISIGTIGLIKAVSSFKADYGNRFATYAIRCIENEILMHFRSKKKSRADVSLFEPIGTDKEGNQIHLVDIIENEDPDVIEDISMENDLYILKHNMKKLLTKREYYILVRRYGLDGMEEMTQRQIAGTLRISRSYVSRIEKRALEKLKKILE